MIRNLRVLWRDLTGAAALDQAHQVATSRPAPHELQHVSDLAERCGYGRLQPWQLDVLRRYLDVN